MAFSQALANPAPLLEHQLIAEVVTIMKEVTTNLLYVWSESIIVREKGTGQKLTEVVVRNVRQADRTASPFM